MKILTEDEFNLYEELHEAARQLLRYNGVDKDRAIAAGKRLTEATHAITEWQNDYDDTDSDGNLL